MRRRKQRWRRSDPLRVRFYGARRGKADVAVIPAAFVVPFPSRSDLCEVKLRKKSMQPSFRLAVTEAREACARRERRRCAVTGDGPGMSSSDCGDDGVARGESYDEDDSCSLVSSESEASSSSRTRIGPKTCSSPLMRATPRRRRTCHPGAGALETSGFERRLRRL